MPINKTIIGRLEKVDLPELDLSDMDAKIDTGAYSSSIHCHDMFENVDDKTLIFKLLDPEHPDYNEREIRFKNYSKTIVKSSNGLIENRFKIKTELRIGNKIYLSHFTLTDRSDMKYPILLGREVLKKGFLVDVVKKYIIGN